MPDVLARRAGLPIALVLVYKCVAVRMGIRVTGVKTPGHLLARVENAGSPMLVDPFAGGRVLSRETLAPSLETRAGRG